MKTLSQKALAILLQRIEESGLPDPVKAAARADLGEYPEAIITNLSLLLEQGKIDDKSTDNPR
jgi:hypothetical protein